MFVRTFRMRSSISSSLNSASLSGVILIDNLLDPVVCLHTGNYLLTADRALQYRLVVLTQDQIHEPVVNWARELRCYFSPDQVEVPMKRLKVHAYIQFP